MIICLCKTIWNHFINWTSWAWWKGSGIPWTPSCWGQQSLSPCCPPQFFLWIRCILKGINLGIPWHIYSTGMKGAEFTHYQIIICFPQTLLLPEICIMWAERREDSFCNMFSLLAAYQGYYRERRRKTSICNHMSNACPSLWLPGKILFLISKLDDFDSSYSLDHQYYSLLIHRVL